MTRREMHGAGGRMGGEERGGGVLRRGGTIARLGSRSYATYDVSPNILGTRQPRAVWFPVPFPSPSRPRFRRPSRPSFLPRNPGGLRASGCRGRERGITCEVAN